MGEIFNNNLNLVNKKQEKKPDVTPRRQTFMQWKMHDTRQRGLSHRYSTAGQNDFGQLKSEEAHLDEMFPREQRLAKVKWYIFWGAINTAIGSYAFVIMLRYWTSWNVDCIRKLDVWLLIYCMI